MNISDSCLFWRTLLPLASACYNGRLGYTKASGYTCGRRLFIVSLLCYLQSLVYFVQFCPELLVCVGKVCDSLACMQDGRMVSVADILSNL